MRAARERGEKESGVSREGEQSMEGEKIMDERTVDIEWCESRQRIEGGA